MKNHLKLSQYFTWALLTVIVLQIPGSIFAMEPEQQPLTPQKQNLVQRLAADYKETWQLYKNRRAGKASPQELEKLEERMKSIRKAAIRAGIIAAFIAALFVGKWGYKKYQAKATEKQAAQAAKRIAAEERKRSQEERKLGIEGTELKEIPRQYWEKKLMETIESRDYNEVKELLKTGKVTPNIKLSGLFGEIATPLHKAVQNNDLPMLQLLLNYNADPNIQDSYGNTPLLFAAAENNKDAVQILLDTPRIDVNLGGNYTPLASTKDPAIAELLLRNGANPNAGTNPNLRPLFLAVQSEAKNPQMVAVLLRYGADHFSKNEYGYTPATLAIYNNKKAVIPIFFEFFKEKGIKSVDDKGNTLLHMAAFYNKREIAQRLIQLGADLFAKNNNGNTPIDVAKNREMKSLIQEAINRRIVSARTALQTKLREAADMEEQILKYAFPEEMARREKERKAAPAPAAAGRQAAAARAPGKQRPGLATEYQEVFDKVRQGFSNILTHINPSQPLNWDQDPTFPMDIRDTLLQTAQTIQQAKRNALDSQYDAAQDNLSRALRKLQEIANGIGILSTLYNSSLLHPWVVAQF